MITMIKDWDNSNKKVEKEGAPMKQEKKHLIDFIEQECFELKPYISHLFDIYKTQNFEKKRKVASK